MSKQWVCLTVLVFVCAAGVASSAISLNDGDWQVAGNDMYALPSGRVGIDTENPERKLHIIGDVLVEAVAPPLYIPLGQTVSSPCL